VVEGYDRVADLGRAGKRALIGGDWETLGELMNENHAVQQHLGASGPENDRLIDVALKAGAGGGGTVIALTHDRMRVLGALEAAGAAEAIELGIGAGSHCRGGLTDM